MLDTAFRAVDPIFNLSRLLICNIYDAREAKSMIYDEETIKVKLELSEDELLIEIGRSVYKSAIQPNYKFRGEEFISNITENFRDDVCTDPRIQTILKDEDAYEMVMIVSALIDCIGGMLVGVSPVTVCVMLAKRGLKSICKESCDV